jgi:TDG/mug DNA glycosylase family protein
VVLGLQPETFAGAEMFVLPNPSGRNANFRYGEMLAAFKGLHEHLLRSSRNPPRR